MSYYITCTRFNNQTWNENCTWREKHKWKGCIYNSPVKIRNTMILNSYLFVLEMNNDTNKIMGIEVIKNAIHLKNKKKFRVYSNQYYNRFVYKSNTRIDRDDFTPYEENIITVLDTLLFKGARHSKRGQGITQIPEWIRTSKIRDFDFITFFKNIFIRLKKEN